MQTEETPLANGSAHQNGVNGNGAEQATSAAHSRSPTPATGSEPEVEADNAAQAEEVKERGNAAFRAKEYGLAIQLYSEAIGAWCLTD